MSFLNLLDSAPCIYSLYKGSRFLHTESERESSDCANFAKKRKETDSVLLCGGLLWDN